MSKKHHEIFSNQSAKHENSIFSKTGYSNSRLSVSIWDTPPTKNKFWCYDN